MSRCKLINFFFMIVENSRSSYVGTTSKAPDGLFISFPFIKLVAQSHRGCRFAFKKVLDFSPPFYSTGGCWLHKRQLPIPVARTDKRNNLNSTWVLDPSFLFFLYFELFTPRLSP